MKDFGEAMKIASHFRLSRDLLPKSARELEQVSRVPYLSSVDSVMDAMIKGTTKVGLTFGRASLGTPPSRRSIVGVGSTR